MIIVTVHTSRQHTCSNAKSLHLSTSSLYSIHTGCAHEHSYSYGTVTETSIDQCKNSKYKLPIKFVTVTV